MCEEKLSRFGVTVLSVDGNVVLFICHIQSIKASKLRQLCLLAVLWFFCAAQTPHWPLVTSQDRRGVLGWPSAASGNHSRWLAHSGLKKKKKKRGDENWNNFVANFARDTNKLIEKSQCIAVNSYGTKLISECLISKKPQEWDDVLWNITISVGRATENDTGSSDTCVTKCYSINSPDDLHQSENPSEGPSPFLSTWEYWLQQTT